MCIEQNIVVFIFLFSIKVNYSNFLFECILIEKEAAQVRQSHPKSYGKNVFGFRIEEDESKRALATLFRLRTCVGCIYIFFLFFVRIAHIKKIPKRK